MTEHAHRPTVLVLKKDGYWVGLSEDLAGGSTGDTLPELLAEIESFKQSPAGIPPSVEYVAGQPEIATELNAVYAAYTALPPNLRPVAVPWDPDTDRPVNPVHAGPYTNPEQLSYLEQLHARLGVAAH